jgi:C1A family cysteine protease
MEIVKPVHRFGRLPDIKDPRDYHYSTSLYIRALPELPKKADISLKCPPVYQQGDLGSCVANSVGGNIEFIRMFQKLKVYTPSRLFIYYNAREMEGTIDEDSGCTIRDGIKTVANLGVCPETIWEYFIPNFAIKPPTHCYQEALNSQVINYRRIGYTLSEMKSCLVEGFPFIIGVDVFENFPMETETGIIPMPKGECIGGHAMLVVGYDDDARVFKIRNSWGEEWGESGYGYIPYDYLTDMSISADYWTIRVIESEGAFPVIQPVAPSQNQFITFWNALMAFLKIIFKK